MRISCIKFSSFVLLPLLVLIAGYLMPANALNQTYTVCPSGCDFTTLTEASLHIGLGDDTIVLTEEYVFDPNLENFTVNFPDGIELICESGAGKFGDANEVTRHINTGSDFTVEGCTFENVEFDSSGKTNINFLNNAFSPDGHTMIVMTNSDGFHLEGNMGLQLLQVQNSDNGLIENNAFECRTFNFCINITTAGGSPDYSDPDQIPSNITIRNNDIANYVNNSGGDWVYFGAGENVVFANNIVHSAVVMDDLYMTLVSVQSAQVEFIRNYIISPEKVPNSSQGIWAFNIRADEYDIDVLFENNTIIAKSGDTCIGLFDNGGNSNIPINIAANYNLCYQGGPVANGIAINLQYVIGSSNVTLQDSFNGFYGFNQLIADSTDTITALNSNTITADPVLRLQNLDTSDNAYPVPMSRYFDVDGTRDIGAFGDPNAIDRITAYAIDQNCTVDYTTCHANDTDILSHVILSGDAITMGSGTYSGFNLQGPMSNISITGAGDTTLIDVNSGEYGIYLNNITNSTFQNFRVENATSPSPAYHMTSPTMSTALEDYDTYGIAIYVAGATCEISEPLFPDNLEITNFEGVGTHNLSLFLVRLPEDPPEPEALLTVYMPATLATTPAEIEAKCGVPQSIIEAYVSPVFELVNGEYIYNAAGVSAAGIFPTGGATDPEIVIQQVAGAGTVILNSSNNSFKNFTFTNNDFGIHLHGTSSNNSFEACDITGNFDQSVHTDSPGDNTFSECSLEFEMVKVTNTGVLNIFYNARAFVVDALTNLPVEGATVVFTNALSDVVATLVTDALGLTPYTSILAAVLDQSSHTITSGGRNPMTVAASADDYEDDEVTANLDSVSQQFDLSLSPHATLHIIKQVVNDNQGSATAGDFQIHVKHNGADIAGSPDVGTEAPGKSYRVPAGTYVVSEAPVAGYATSYSGDCDAIGIIALSPGEEKTCIVLNDDIIPASPDVAFSSGSAPGGGGSGPPPSHFTAPETVSSVVTEIPADHTFTGYKDLGVSDRHFRAFEYLYRLGAVTGHPDGTVRPDAPLQRDQATKIIVTTLGLFSPDTRYCTGGRPFPDIGLMSWSSQYICLGKKLGMLRGYGGTGDGPYHPERTINRAEFLALMVRILKHFHADLEAVGQYSDVQSDAWYAEYSSFAHQHQLFLSLNRLMPDRAITLREAVRILHMLHEKKFF